MTESEASLEGGMAFRAAAGMNMADARVLSTAPTGTASDARAIVRPIEPDRFDEIASAYCEVVQEQTACFLRSRWGAHRVETVTVEQDGRRIGAAAVTLIQPPLIDSGLAIIKWGPLWCASADRQDRDLLQTVLAALKQEYVVRRGYYLSIMPHADPDRSELTVKTLENLGFQQGESLPAPERYLVNVTLDPVQLRKSLDQKWRYNLKKAERNALDISIVDAETGLKRFVDLYDQMMARKRFKDTSAIYTLPDLVNTKHHTLTPMFAFVRHQGTDTAGAVIDTSGERAVYLYGATDDRALPLKAGYALHWWIAELLCDMPDVRWYDLGGNDFDPGLHQFKKGFVGKQGAIEITPPSYYCCDSALSRFVGKSMFRIRDAKAAILDLSHRIKAR